MSDTTSDRPAAGDAGGMRPALPDERVVALLRRHGVAVEAIDPRTTRFLAVLVSPQQFNKPRTNLLLRRSAATGGSAVYVDEDLAYHGPDPALLSAVTGPCRQHWRRLKVPPVRGNVDETLVAVLEFLQSPLAPTVRSTLATPAAEPAKRTPALGRLLASAGEVVPPAALEEAYRTSFRQELAAHLAVITTRPVPPSSAVLVGRSGCGRDHLMLAAAHLLLKAGKVEQVVRVSGALVAAGCVFPAEQDAALVQLLTEAAAWDRRLVLLQDLDLLLSPTPVAAALVGRSLDRGLRVLATARSDALLERLEADESLARRLVVVPVPPLSRPAVAAALEGLAKRGPGEVAPAAIQTALHLAPEQPAGEPAASLGLLGAALAEAAWRGSPQVGPDDVVAGLRNDRPETSLKE